MGGIGIKVKFIDKENPVFYPVDTILMVEENERKLKYAQTNMFLMELDERTVAINLNRVEYIDFIYQYEKEENNESKRIDNKNRTVGD